MERMIRMLGVGVHPELLGDGLMAVALTVFAQLNLRFSIDQSTRYGSGFAAAAVTAIATAVIALRRRAPLLIATYSVARHARGRLALAGAATAALALLVLMLRVPVIGTVANIPFNLVPFTGAFVAGRVLRRRHSSHSWQTIRH